MRQSEDKKVRQRQFARPSKRLSGPYCFNQKAPLVLAGVDTMITYYREVDTYPHTEVEAISGNQEHRRTDEFAAEVRVIVSRRFESTISNRLDRVESLRSDRRSSIDVTEITLRQGRTSRVACRRR